MPRGFLVKRSKRPGGSYRARPAERGVLPAGAAPWPPAFPEGPVPGPAGLPPGPAGRDEAGGGERAAGPPWCPSPLRGSGPLGGPGPGPARPAGAEVRRAFPERCLSSPASAESFPAFPSSSGAAGPGPRGASLQAAKRGAKRAKAPRKPSFADEVTTSPVLGLKIKAEEPGAPAGAARGGRPPLGEFICQLCKERYADPFALAQHRCSRIVRVEYRCPECAKVFSCPANLASHRRWHKPRPAGAPQDRPHRDSSAAARLPDPAAAPCPFCHRRFRRPAYLRKHLGTHEEGSVRAPMPPAALGLALPGPPAAEPGERRGLWPAVRDELLLLPGPGPQHIFPCKHCPATFFGSPGLARHVDKCHPSDGRRLLLLQVPMRPGGRGGPEARLDHR
ncbi:insulinoma-associated protein 2 [Ornithorhynchus anatinus]|uniref:insulinoma-associated protein 2 n=1 Tax=Ornithorhynchus anatinus TaxID=9258 RepID=UPI0010A8CCE6|nr:insulinoma-associated protein 2 [Ornithorhynchus anatinus]